MIRTFAPSDAEQIMQVWYDASKLAHPFLSDDFLEAEREKIAQEWMPIAETSVCEHEHRVVGFLSLIGNEVGGIFVHPDKQGFGFGRALMDNASALRPILELEVFEANSIGRQFYDRYGFIEIGQNVHEPTQQPTLRLRYER